MPVRHRDHAGEDIAPPDPKRCKHCDESRSSCGNESEGSEARESWRVTLDHDLVETLSAIYPEWFKPQSRRDRAASPRSPEEDTFSSSAESEMMNGGSTSGCGSSLASCSPAGCSSAGSSPAGCSPRVSPPKVVVDDTPLQPLLGKHKESLKVKLMMRRPINQLVAQGIMPPLKTPPGYFEQCKQLERAKTGDLLKAKIQRRPDRQELERRHILEQESHVDPSLAEKQRMLKKARLADQLNDQLSHRPGPLELIKKNILHTEENIETAVKSGTLSFRATCEGSSGRPEHPSSYLGPDDASPSPSPQHPAPGKEKNRKKSKQKQQPKARFKFHEYKGPPSASRQPAASLGDDTPYDLLLQQQRLLLQLTVPPSPAPSSTNSDCSDTHARLQDMKVSDLRAECKRLGLPVSGPKQQLLDRLRPATDTSPPASPDEPEDIVRSQRRQIEELERKLEASRSQLETVRRNAAGATDQSRRLLQAHLCVMQLRQQLDALQRPVPASRLVLASADAAYLLPITILPPAPPPVPQDDSHIMDDVLEILAEQGEFQNQNHHETELNHNLIIPEDRLDRIERPPSAMDIPQFEDMEELSLPSFPDDRPELDLQEFGIDPTPSPGMAVDDFVDTELLPNMFGRGHMPQCDPLLGGVLAPPPKPALKHFSWDKIEFDAT